MGLEVPEQWVFEDEGQSGATLIAQAWKAAGPGPARALDVLLVYSPDRLARK